MKITQVHSQHAVAPTQANPQAQADAKARAIAKLVGNQPQATQQQAQAAPVANPNNISPEEVGAIKSQVQLSEDEQESTDTSSNIEATDSEVEAKAAETKVEDPLSRQFAVLARKEKALRAKAMQQEQALKAREAELAAREAEIAAKTTQFDSSKYISKDRFKNNPLEVMAETGLTYDEILQQQLNLQARNPYVDAELKTLKDEIKRLNEINENNQKQAKTQQEQAYESAINQIRTDAKKLVYTDPDFETIKATNSVNDVVELIEKTFKDEGVVMSVEDAAKEVEEYLVEQLSTYASKIEKIKKKLQPASTAQVKPQTQKPTLDQATKQPQTMKTLTNNTGSTRQLSAKERAILAFKGELK